MVEDKTFNILKHRLVPEHILLTAEEIKELTDRLNIRVSQLPKIYTTDATVKAMEGDVGDVVKITRPSPTAGKTVYYRIVVKKTRKK
jgi:DNA-directed RNA polymerase subunit H